MRLTPNLKVMGSKSLYNKRSKNWLHWLKRYSGSVGSKGTRDGAHITSIQTLLKVKRWSVSHSHLFPDKIKFSAARVRRMWKSRGSWLLPSPGYVRLDPGVRRALILGVTCVQSLVVSDSLRPRGLRHTRLPCLVVSPRVCSDSRPLSRWCHLFLCRPLLLLPSVFPSIRVFSNELALCIRFWSFKVLEISPSNSGSKGPGLISFRIDKFDLLAVQGTLKSLLQHHSSKASILQHSALLMVKLSHLHVTTGKTIALTIWTKWCLCVLIHCLALS